MLVSTGSNTEETVFGVDSIKSAIGTYLHPGDIVTNGPNLVALLTKILGRNKHSKVGLSASGGECSTDVLNFALGIFKTEDKHMLSHPAFLHTEV